MELTCHADVVDFKPVRSFWDLTCDFWAENEGKKYKGNKQKGIGDDDNEDRGRIDCRRLMFFSSGV